MAKKCLAEAIQNPEENDMKQLLVRGNFLEMPIIRSINMDRRFAIILVIEL